MLRYKNSCQCPPSGSLLTLPLLSLAITMIGCSPAADYRDQRLAEFAQQTMSQQSQQNQRLADQSSQIVAESQQLAVAATELVAHDALARRELITSHAELTGQLSEQQHSLDAERHELDQERRAMATARSRDPVIAAAITSTGLLVACVLPLVLAGLIVLQLRSAEPEHAAVVELLLSELTSTQPRVLRSPDRARLPENRQDYYEQHAERPELDDEAYPF